MKKKFCVIKSECEERERERVGSVYVACVCLVLCRLDYQKKYSDMAHITLIKERSYRSRIANKNANGRERTFTCVA